MRIIIFLLLLSTSAIGQVVQETNGRRADRINIFKEGLRVPIGDTASTPFLLNYSGDSARGGVVYDTTLSKLCFWTGIRWVCVDDAGGGGSGTVTSVATGLGLSGGTITTTGTVVLDTASSVVLSRQRATNTFPILRYGNVNNNNYHSYNAGPIYASALNVGSSAVAATPDSLNMLIGESVGDSLSTGYANIVLGNNTFTRGSTAFRNVVIGNRAFGSSASANNTGTENAVIGNLALRLNTTGFRNAVLGDRAGETNTTGRDLVIIGAQAAPTHTTGNSNVYIGSRSWNVMQTGSANVGIGETTAPSATGSSLTIVGYNAASGLTSGQLDAFGRDAGDGWTTGTQNAFLSFGAGGMGGTTTNTGSDNLVMGYVAMNAATGLGALATSRNVSIGSQSSRRIGSGFNDNTMIGFGAGNGTSTASNITGANNIGIGSMAVLPSLSSANQITFWVGASGGTGGYNALTRFTGGGWLINNTTSAVTSATASTALEINGTTGAVLFPRLTTTNRDALTATNGMVLYNSTTDKLQVYAAGAWTDLH